MSSHEYTRSWQNGDLRVIECETCGFRHLLPLPTVEDLVDIYRERFGGEVRTGFSQRKKEDADYWKMAFGRRLTHYRRLLDSWPVRILDVGCGTGDFLAFFKAHGAEAYGIEPSRHFVGDLAERGIAVIREFVEDVTDDQWKVMGPFDVINFSMFLEHIREPQSVLRQAIRALRPGGIVSLESPNDFNPLQLAAVRALGVPQWWINKLHINYFDFPSLERLAACEGLNPCARDAQFPMEMFLLQGDNYIGNSHMGRNLHRKRVTFETNLFEADNGQTLARLYQALSASGFGRTAIVYARKESP